ncbi:uncharacterized protein LOC131995810 [Stomoxys calcitrans]|uniref:uncharacterized protein LOC131995810 n=1 Tax=Stomoxys calcitrans TaxID=35570 RepID=UPI0027E29D9F|nr:uncharacterized protein LOC131995810 [Stomoxys calcitrans]
MPQEVIAKKIKFLSCNSSYDPKYQKYHYFQINDGVIDLKVNLLSTLNYFIGGELSLAMWQNKQKNFRTLLEYDVNVCRAFEKPEGKIIIGLMDFFFRESNMPKKCPIAKGNYTWRLTPDSLILPPFVMSTKHQLVIKFYQRQKSKKEYISNDTIFFQIS